MAQVKDLVEQALRLIGVAAEDEVATPDQLSTGVAAYNDMLHSWKTFGVDVEHEDQGPVDTVKMARQWHRHIVYMLGAELAGQYTVQPPAAGRFWDALQAHFHKPVSHEFNQGLVRLPSWRVRYETMENFDGSTG